eukprot:1898644-Rhodomonas_salina.1
MAVSCQQRPIRCNVHNPTDMDGREAAAGAERGDDAEQDPGKATLCWHRRSRSRRQCAKVAGAAAGCSSSSRR